MKKIVLFFLTGALCLVAWAQQVPAIGIDDQRPEIHAFTHATLYVDYQTVVEDATLLIEDGRVAGSGKNVSIPAGAIIHDLEGKYIYPSFIDLSTHYGLPATERPGRGGGFSMTSMPQVEASYKTAFNWNEAIRPYARSSEEFEPDEKTAQPMRKQGFGAVLTFKPDGIARGTSALVCLSMGSASEVMLNERMAAHYSFEKGTSRQDYPGSLMGSIALLRQTYYDALWYQSQTERAYTDISLSAWNENQSLPQVFEVRDKLSLLRADKIGDEFGVQYIIKTAGDEYQLLKEVKNTGAPLIVPIDFPDAPDVQNPYQANLVPLEDLKHWELAPANLVFLDEAGIIFAITADGLSDMSSFLKNIRKAVQYGLKKETALKALTSNPAELMGVDDRLGKLREGHIANFLICSDDLFSNSCTLFENWIRGKKHVVSEMDRPDRSGTYRMMIGDREFKMEIGGTPGKPSFKVWAQDTISLKATGELDDYTFRLYFKPEKDARQDVRLVGWIADSTFYGDAYFGDGHQESWSARYAVPLEQKKEKNKAQKEPPEMGPVLYPFVAYGNEMGDLPQTGTYLIRNATVWTNEPSGIMENTDVLVKGGKIAGIGTGLSDPEATIIDGTGKHLTSGVIDEHSHIAGSGGTNEGSHAVTSEVRMIDVIDPEDLNIYRQLSGGVTAAQILHGSANPVGGQSALIKHRWGVAPDQLLIHDGAQFLKHALGENVKQSRLPSFLSSRYPQTRMGVEAIIRDAYTRARDYQQEWEAYAALPEKTKGKTPPPRVDLRMEALREVLEKKSFMTCHAYVQSEINMIMKLAEDFGITAHTLIHNSEGYKVADKIAEHGAFASNLPDWWAYKYEVYQAIPYNTALQVQQGVLTAIHSDNAVVARHLNLEAAKAVKYGGLTQEEAWKTITLNPARILHLEHRMGSIKVGKDADLVLWNQNPLSVYAYAEKTMVDGILYFDIEKDRVMQEEVNKERNRLIQKILGENGTASVRSPRFNQQYEWDDEDTGYWLENTGFEK
jgi:imidazolonepropionase-like amidohydrolase